MIVTCMDDKKCSATEAEAIRIILQGPQDTEAFLYLLSSRINSADNQSIEIAALAKALGHVFNNTGSAKVKEYLKALLQLPVHDSCKEAIALARHEVTIQAHTLE
mmetsp:Transcript_48397/g.113268  ORF Transcript_48397/g.113268 Transcript_48397/m.113268 type:complete len:105 (-) Transcript_48397:172-486(-)